METKPGYLTTEFWVTIFTNAYALGDVVGIWNTIPDRYATILMAVVSGAYAASRGIAKSGVTYNPNAR